MNKHYQQGKEPQMLLAYAAGEDVAGICELTFLSRWVNDFHWLYMLSFPISSQARTFIIPLYIATH